MTNSDDLDQRLDLARSAAAEAARLTLRYFRTGVDVERKSDDSPVTIADREAEQLLRQRIGDAFPQDGILGEEFPEVEGSSGYRWILDPIDGTKSFISGVPLYGTMVGVEYGGRSLIGAVVIPGTGESIYAATGQGARYQIGDSAPAAAHVSNCSELSSGLFLSSQLDSFRERGAWDAYIRLESEAWITRTWGDCYGYLLVATGRAVAMVDPIMSVWDAAALQPIMEEAGGTFTDWSGKPDIHAGEGIGTNGLVLQQVLSITRPYCGLGMKDERGSVRCKVDAERQLLWVVAAA